MVFITREGMIKGMGVCMIALGLFILGNITVLTNIYVNYYAFLEKALADEIGLIWLRLAFEPTSGAVIGTTLALIGVGMIRLRNWARIMALALMWLNFFVLVCWILFTQFQYISAIRSVQVLIMYGLIAALLNLKWIKPAFS